MLVDKSTTERHSIPHEQGAWVEIAKLYGTELDDAGEASMVKVAKKFGVLPNLKEIMEIAESRRDDVEADEAKNRAGGYDPVVVINAGLVAWSYDGEVNAENIERLDAETRDWLHELIVLENTRPLGNVTRLTGS